MKRSWWRTGPPIKHQQPIAPLTGGQLLRQLLILALSVLIWGRGLFLLLGAVNASAGSPVAQMLPTDTPPPSPTRTSTTAATHTPLPAATDTPSPTGTATTTATAEPTATSLPTETPTSAPTAAAPPPTGDAAISFQRDVQPIFNQICAKCHGEEEVKEGLSLTSYAEVMRGSDNGPIVVPGDPENSLLVQQVVNGKMPKRGPKLLPAQIRALTEWVAAGAPNN